MNKRSVNIYEKFVQILFYKWQHLDVTKLFLSLHPRQESQSSTVFNTVCLVLMSYSAPESLKFMFINRPSSPGFIETSRNRKLRLKDYSNSRTDDWQAFPNNFERKLIDQYPCSVTHACRKKDPLV